MSGRAGAAALASLFLAGAAALGGCAVGGEEEPPQLATTTTGPTTGATTPTRTVVTTRVEVVKGLGGARGAFDPATIYRRLAPGVVTVISRFDAGGGTNPFEEPEGESGGLGSGFVLDAEGYVATNAHVVTTGDPPALRRASEVYIVFGDGNRVPARIVGEDPNSDVALLKLNPAGLELTPLTLGSTERLAVGEPVAAIGSPFGERQSLSVGVVSAKDRDIESLTDFRIGDAIQTDAAINRGNSGGPLLDSGGEVIGINSSIKSSSGGGEGVGFAVPVETVERALRELRTSGRVGYGFLGVTTQPLYPQLADHLEVSAERGALVTEVQPGSPAAEAGLRGGSGTDEFQGERVPRQIGDVIVRVDGQTLEQRTNLSDVVSRKGPGDRIELEVLRDGERETIAVRLGSRPSRAPRR